MKGIGMAGDDRRDDKSIQKIMAGTMKAVARQGTHKLSVSDICDASGVARGTFYRYFTSKEDALAALGRHLEDGVSAAFAAAIEANPDPEQRVEVVLDTIIAYRAAGGGFGSMIEVAPGFTLDFIRETFPKLVDVVTEALGPAVEESPLVRSGSLTARQLGELFMRAVISMLLLPGGRSNQVPPMIVSLFRVDTSAVTPPRRKRKARVKAS